MLEKAIARYNVDVFKSVFIGDSQRDVDAGKKTGLHTLLVKPNANLCDYLPEINKIEKLV
jgi:D-glycero-D-manno-heptose 1,7-bisphosphate phosphatase